MNAIAHPLDSAASMTSLEIAELVGSRHDSVKRTVERLAGSKIINLPPLVGKSDNAARGRPLKIYVFTGEQGKRDSIIVVAQLCPEFTARLVDRWRELEARVAVIPGASSIDLPQIANLSPVAMINEAIATGLITRDVGTREFLALLRSQYKSASDVVGVTARPAPDVAQVTTTELRRITTPERQREIFLQAFMNLKTRGHYLGNFTIGCLLRAAVLGADKIFDAPLAMRGGKNSVILRAMSNRGMIYDPESERVLFGIKAPGLLTIISRIGFNDSFVEVLSSFHTAIYCPRKVPFSGYRSETISIDTTALGLTVF